MNTQLWKTLLIVALVGIAAWNVYPPQDKLRGGTDLMGGTVLIYDIDTTGLDREEQKGLAQRMIPILLKRVDPTNNANIVMRSQGDSRIEIRLPVASTETIRKRKTYELALEALENENINLRRVRQALSMDAAQRQELIDVFTTGSEQRKAILDNLANAFDELERVKGQRDTLAGEKDLLKTKIDSLDMAGELVEAAAPQWSALDVKAQRRQVKDYVDNRNKNIEEPLSDTKPAQELIAQYLAVFAKWAEAANDLAQPETGKHAKWQQAIAQLTDLNLSIEKVTNILEAVPKKSAKRQEHIDRFKQDFPGRAEKIDGVVAAFDEYSVIGGRLDDPEDLKRMLKGAGVLVFRILPIHGDGTFTEGQIDARAEQLRTSGPKQASNGGFLWIEVEEPETFGVPNGIVEVFGDKTYVLASNKPKEIMLHGGEKKWKLKRAYPSSDQNGRRAIGFTHDAMGGKLFYEITRNNPGRQLCIILDDLALSAPRIDPEKPIGTSGVITGDFSELQIGDMVDKLNAGSFPARLSDVPISEKSIGATIGVDNRNQGIYAAVIGLASVAAFMAIYYIGPGFIAVCALLLNLLFILAMMVMFRATFTLPGIAAVILTIGMSVDANVLIFERIREEQDRGSSLRIAIANGYQRAFRTIFDANLTTFIVALILYMVASEEIKGFAIVLMLGIIASMFTALFITRTVFNFLLNARIIRNHLKMFKLIGSPNVNWAQLRGAFLTISLVLIAGGMAVFFTRDEATNSKYGIEFTGGTLVQIELLEGSNLSRQDVEDKIHNVGVELGSDALAAANVNSIGDSELQFEITTTETNKTTAVVTFSQAGQSVKTVTDAITQAAAKSLATLYNLHVAAAGDKTFNVSTSQVNKMIVTKVLDDAFGDDAAVSEPQVNEMVSNAVKKAFTGQLKIRENLGVTIAESQEISDSDAELPEFLGGIKFECTLDRPAKGAEVLARFREIRFKPDARDIQWYRYALVSNDLSKLDPDATIDSFTYVSVLPEAGFRDFDDNEWGRFVENEKTRINRAASLQTTLGRVTQIDPSIGAQAKTRALIAIVMSLIAIIAYIWVRFGTARYGVAAIVALVHDVCITLGAVTVCAYIAETPIGRMLLIQDFKIDLPMIAALLTIIGYSLNDTIVVFDRIRENRGKLSNLSPHIVSNSINQTLSRTLLTSLTTFMVVLIMYIWGGAGLRGFTFAMLIGIIVGTYSSIAIAAPILLIGNKNNKAVLRK